ncbi:hypothetical protein [Demequina lutea]|uniref:Uncharacterized protein n=1 Tax=Demequina lutea TaxID=431489 RepID=A0A7Z0CJT7_9MICO|nr:hypothetical protein [Demequina lutea]NYI41117.1 hypothetical protein [Demequina lutea]
MDAKPRPLLGSLLGLLLGIVVVALLWQLGVVPPDRLVLFGVLAVTVALVTIILTQRTVLVRKRFVMLMVLSGLLAGVAVAGIPDAIAGGSITDGCSADGTSSLGSKTPAQTSIADPFAVTRTDTVQWTAGSTAVLTNWRSALGMDVGGFQVKTWSGSSANNDQKQSNSGSAAVASHLKDIEGSTGITLAGIYHMYGHLDADQRTCDMSAYVRVQGEGAFTGALNRGLWIALGALSLITIIMAGVVRHSITRAARAAASGLAPMAAAQPPATSKPPAEPTQPSEAGRQTSTDTRSRPPQEPNKAAPASRETPGSNVRATDNAPVEQMGARGVEPTQGVEPMPGNGEAAVPGADGDVLPETDNPGATTPLSDGPEAPPITDSPDRPAGEAG